MIARLQYWRYRVRWITPLLPVVVALALAACNGGSGGGYKY